MEEHPSNDDLFMSDTQGLSPWLWLTHKLINNHGPFPDDVSASVWIMTVTKQDFAVEDMKQLIDSNYETPDDWLDGIYEKIEPLYVELLRGNPTPQALSHV